MPCCEKAVCYYCCRIVRRIPGFLGASGLRLALLYWSLYRESVIQGGSSRSVSAYHRCFCLLRGSVEERAAVAWRKKSYSSKGKKVVYHTGTHVCTSRQALIAWFQVLSHESPVYQLGFLKNMMYFTDKLPVCPCICRTKSAARLRNSLTAHPPLPPFRFKLLFQ